MLMIVFVLSDLTCLPLLGEGESHGILLIKCWMICPPLTQSEKCTCFL